MASFNKLIVMGNITREIELKYTQGGTAVCELGLALNEKRKGANDEWIEEVVFLDATLWGRTAEIANEYLQKGDPVLLEGRLKMDSWTDKNTNQKRTKLKMTVDRLTMVGKKGAGGGSGGSEHGDAYEPPVQSHQGGESASQGSPAKAGSYQAEDVPF